MASSSQGGSSARSKIEAAEEYKQVGNAAVKEQDWKKAMRNYHLVFTHLTGLQVPGEQGEAQNYAQMLGTRPDDELTVPHDLVATVQSLKQSTALNMALVYLKQEKYDQCVKRCTEAMQGDDATGKAAFRRGQALLALGQLDEAKRDLEQAAVKSPGDPGIKQEMAKLQRAYKGVEAKEKKMFRNIFGGEGKGAADADDGTEADVQTVVGA